MNPKRWHGAAPKSGHTMRTDGSPQWFKMIHGMARFLALYQGEYSRERLILRLRTVHPKTITRLAQNDTGNVADRHMKQILSIYNGAGRAHSLPCKR